MKKRFVFLFAFVGFLSFASLVLARIILPNPLGGVKTFAELISNITFYISGLIGVLAVLMFVIAGIQFVTSAGNPGRIDQAKKTAIYAAIGAAVALSGAGLIQLVERIIKG